MLLKSQLLSLAERYCTATGVPLNTVSSRVFDDGKVLARLAQGSAITTDRYELALSWFSANWPDKVDWPDEVSRPKAAA